MCGVLKMANAAHHRCNFFFTSVKIHVVVPKLTGERKHDATGLSDLRKTQVEKVVVEVIPVVEHKQAAPLLVAKQLRINSNQQNITETIPSPFNEYFHPYKK